MLNRYGLVDVDLSGIWGDQSQLTESDERLRALDRQRLGNPHDKDAYNRWHKAMERAGKHSELIRHHLDRHYTNFTRLNGHWSANSAAKEARRLAHDSGKHLADHISKREGESWSDFGKRATDLLSRTHTHALSGTYSHEPTRWEDRGEGNGAVVFGDSMKHHDTRNREENPHHKEHAEAFARMWRRSSGRARVRQAERMGIASPEEAGWRGPYAYEYWHEPRYWVHRPEPAGSRVEVAVPRSYWQDKKKKKKDA